MAHTKQNGYATSSNGSTVIHEKKSHTITAIDKASNSAMSNGDILAATLPPKEAGLTELVICAGGIYASLCVRVLSNIPAKHLTDSTFQSILGITPRAHHNHAVWSCHFARDLLIPCVPQHHSVRLRSIGRLCIPTLLIELRLVNTTNIPLTQDPLPPLPRGSYILPRLSVRIRLSEACRIHNIHSREILQARPRNGATRRCIPQEVSSVQIRRRSARYLRCRPLHHLPPDEQQESVKVRKHG